MAEIVILLAIKKIGIALTKGAADQASVQFAKHGRQLLELQGNMGRVAREFHVMHDVLCQMDIRTRNNQVYEGWLAEVRKVAHVMEDMVDEYLYLVGREHDMGFWFYLKKGFRKPRSLLSLNQIAFKVKQIEKDLAHLLEIKNRWVTMINNGDPSNSNYIVSRSQDQANVAHSLDDEDLVGVDENREKLGQWLASHDLGHYVIALIGMGGLGKTALAANVYKKERKKFECHAWVSISQTYSREVVLRNIIKELSRDKVSVLPDTSAMHIRHLEETLMSFLQQRKYLIILDDVWTPKAFEDLSTVFVHNNKGSRLIITTRECNVAALASPGHILTLEALQEDMAWDLFCKKAFPSSGGLGNGARGGLDRQLMDKRVLGFTGLRFLTQILHKYSFGYLGWLSDASLLAPTLGMPLFPSDTCHDCPAELKLLSKEIANKCKGLPLVIVCVGSFLRLREKTVEEWRNINDQLGWELINNSRLDHIRNVLHLSFIYLPTHLKSCFLYCSLFPEGYIFKRKELVRLWTAEGFVKERGGSTLEVVAEGYLKELIDRNILQLVERNTFGRMKKVTMHDILRELAVDLCKKNCFGVAYEDRCGGSLEMDGRRLVLHKLRNDDHKTIPGIHQLRTFITLDSSMPLSTITLLCKESRYMTVLELSGLPIDKIPDAIGDLFNLRHLGLRDTKVKVLPKSVEKLSNLLTLDICGCDIHEFRGIVKLKKLRHLFAEKIIDQSWRDFHCRRGIRITSGLGNLRNLHTLQALEAHDESLRHLGELRQLRSLRLWNVKEIYCADINESIVQMQYLSNLSVNASDENEVLMLNVLVPSLQRLNLRGRLTKGALKECPLFKATEEHKLCYLVLFWSQLEQDPLSSLSRLSHLTYLEFTRAYNGEQLEFCNGWFPKLKILLLVDLPNLSRLEVQERAMVCLEKLFFTNLNSMTEVPSSIEFLMSLKYLGFYQISSDFLTLLHQSSAIKGTQWSHTLRP